MKISFLTKTLTFVFVILSVLTITLNILANQQSGRVHAIYQERIELQDALADMYANTYRLFYLAHNYVVTENNGYYVRYRDVLAQDLFNNGRNRYLALDVSDAERQMINQMADNYAFFITENERALVVLADGDWGGAVHILHNEEYSRIFTELDSLIEDVTTHMINRTDDARVSARSTYAVMRNTSMVMITLTALLSVLAMIYISLRFKPIAKLVKTVRQLAEGDFYKINTNEPISSDEIGELTSDVYTLVSTIQNIDQDLTKMAHAFSDDGDVEHRMDSSSYNGEWKILIDDINTLVDGFVNDMLAAINSISRLADGEADLQIPQMVGKKVILTDALNTINDRLDDYCSWLLEVVGNAQQGIFTSSIDENTSLTGLWLVMIDSINEFVHAVESPVEEVMEVMNQMSQGRFDYTMQGNYQGKFKELSDKMTFTSGQVSSYVKEIRSVINTIRSGNLTLKIKRNYVGIFDEIKISINDIVDTLNSTMEEIYSVASNVLDGASMLSESASSLANDALQQREEISTISEGIVSIDERSKQNTQSAQESSNIASASQKNATVVNEDMSKLLDSMDKISNSSDEISNIIKTIEDIAFQTNLLSLNASVEAARAGEHGRGFSVVAEEVRMLAVKSAQAASQTSALIQDSIHSVNEGMTRAKDTEKSLDTIVESISTLSTSASNIKSQSELQTNALTNLGHSVETVNGAISTTAATSETIASAAEELNTMANKLHEKLSYFKTK